MHVIYLQVGNCERLCSRRNLEHFLESFHDSKIARTENISGNVYHHKSDYLQNIVKQVIWLAVSNQTAYCCLMKAAIKFILAEMFILCV